MGWLFTSIAEGNLASHLGDDPVAVAQRRDLLAARLSRPIHWMDQVHGNEVYLVAAGTGAGGPCDGQVTVDPSIALGVLVADCIPLILLSDECVGVAHVGRRGLVNDVAVATVDLMRAHGARQIHAILGPSICGPCYEVPADMHDEVVALFPQAAATTETGTTALDLPAALIARLDQIGVSAERDPRCTREDASLYSHRRDASSGRCAGVVWR